MKAVSLSGLRRKKECQRNTASEADNLYFGEFERKPGWRLSAERRHL